MIFLKELAEKNNLLISAGSDYHGTNKRVAIGELNKDGIEIDVSSATVLNEILKEKPAG